MGECLREGAIDRLKAAYGAHVKVGAVPDSGKLQRQIFRQTKAPSGWKKNTHEWLTNYDIEGVMKKYENLVDDFWFMGVVPIDFDAQKDATCLWSEICNVCLGSVIGRKKYRVGLVLNLDPHNKDGSHWVAVWADFRPGWERMTYFDSYSVRPDKDAKSVLRLMASWDEQFKAIVGHGLALEYNAVRHQMKNSECGMYCIYFLHCCIMQVPLNKRVPDEVVNLFRRAFFKL